MILNVLLAFFAFVVFMILYGLLVRWWQRKQRQKTRFLYSVPTSEESMKLRLIQIDHELDALKDDLFSEQCGPAWDAYEGLLQDRAGLEDKLYNMYGYSRKVDSE
jgi:hypothetical protein